MILTFLIFWLLFMTAVLSQERIIKYFNLVDKRIFIRDKEVYEKLNRLLDADQISIYRSNIFAKPHMSIRVGYSNNSMEEFEISVSGSDLSDVIEKTYAVAIEEGKIKE